MKKLLLIILAFSIHIAANAVDEFSTLEERMTGKELKETGQRLWVDVQGLGDEKLLHRLAEIFAIHPLALEDVSASQRRCSAGALPSRP